MSNMPELKIGVVAVSRDCFPESLSVTRRENLIKAYKEKYGEADIYECPICIVESEIHMVQALEDIKNAVMHLLCILETSDRRSQRHCLQNILTDRRCLSQQQKSAETTWFREEAMLTVVCSMQAII